MPMLRFFQSLGKETVETFPGSQIVPDGRFAGYFLLRRLHSFTGVVPLTFFLVQHFMINSLALHGAEPFTTAARTLRTLPYLLMIEIMLILAPLYFHGLLGVWLVMRGQATVLRYGYARNWMYFMQRVTGVITIAFVTYHLLHTRFSGTDTDKLFDLMKTSLANPLVFAVYFVGVLASSYHLANGLWGFCITWGLTSGRRAQRVASLVVLGIFAVLSFLSVNALLAFMGKGLTMFG
jgi:succinate dehydrogenase / fumarate reductase cytochrome b subunit